MYCQVMKMTVKYQHLDIYCVISISSSIVINAGIQEMGVDKGY